MQEEKVSISINRNVWKKAKIYVANNDLQLSKFIEYAIKNVIKRGIEN